MVLKVGKVSIVKFSLFCCNELNISYTYSFLELFPICTPLSWPHGLLNKLFQPWPLGWASCLALANKMLVEVA